MLRDEVIKYYYPGNGHQCNCAESMFRAINDYYQLNLTTETLSCACCYGGGCGHDELCGGIAGVLMGLGVMFAPDGKARNSANLNEIRKRFFEEFDSLYPCTSCNTLRSQYAVPERKCESLLVGIADIAEKLIEEYRNEDNSNF